MPDAGGGMSDRTLVLVPMKRPDASKSRLSGALGDDERRALALRLFRQTLDVLAAARQDAAFDVAVVTGSDEVASLCGSAAVFNDPPQGGLNAALSHGAERAVALGYDRLCILPADLAAPEVADIVALLQSPGDVIICPSSDGGTNALLLSPPAAIPLAYGPASAAHHAEAARAAGLIPHRISLGSLRLDVDTSECLTRARAAAPALFPLAAE